MAKAVTPMIHVPDVGATVEWYSRLGFAVTGRFEEDGETNWAELSFGDSRVMLNAGGRPSAAERREVDLYAYVDDVDAVYGALPEGVEVVEGPNDTFYGHRIFIVRDLNGFWITFASECAAPAERPAA